MTRSSCSINHLQFFFIILALHFFTSYGDPIVSYGASPSTFCSRAIKSQTCFAPNISQSFDVTFFMGRWYRIGSTGQSKLENDGGLICQQTNYTLIVPNSSLNSTSLAFKVVNSGLQILSFIPSFGIQTIGKSTKDICYSAKKICGLLSSSGKISQTIAQVGAVVAKLTLPFASEAKGLELASAHIEVEASLIELELDLLAKNISIIQKAVSNISNGATIFNEVEELRTLINLGCNQISSIVQHLSLIEIDCSKINSIATRLFVADSISFLEPLELSSETAIQLSHATTEISEQVGYILSKTTSIDATLESMNAAADLLLLNHSNASTICSKTGSGFENCINKGKFEIILDDDVDPCQKVPYWVLAVDGVPQDGYDSAMLYSCIEESNGDVSKSISILSRNFTLSTNTIEKYLTIATLSGFDFDCHDPFLANEQGTSCLSFID